MITKAEIKKAGRMGNSTRLTAYIAYTEHRKNDHGQNQMYLTEMALAHEFTAGKVGGLFVRENHGDLKEVAQGALAHRMFTEAFEKHVK